MGDSAQVPRGAVTLQRAQPCLVKDPHVGAAGRWISAQLEECPSSHQS